jgi:hypothetical protein
VYGLTVKSELKGPLLYCQQYNKCFSLSMGLELTAGRERGMKIREMIFLNLNNV